MKKNTQYQELSKNEARNKALSYAVECLTHENNSYGYLIDSGYIKKVKDHLLKSSNIYDREFSQLLSEDNIKKWENFHSASSRKKKASELKVAYLSGPHPENDLEVLVDLGILPENVWAFESDNKTYDAAILSAIKANYPFIKIYKGKIQRFFEYSPIKFDLIYLDFCGSIASSESIPTLTSLFFNQVLSSSGILITNFAYVDEATDERIWSNTMKFCANYLAGKSFIEDFEELGGGAIENPFFVSGLTSYEFLGQLKKNPLNAYSQLITRLIIDIGSIITPYQRLVKNKSMTNLFFQEFDKFNVPEEWIEDLEMGAWGASLSMSLMNQLPLIEGIDIEELALSDSFDEKLHVDGEFEKFRKRIVGRLSIDNDEPKLVELVKKIEFLSKGNDLSNYSEKLSKTRMNWKPLKKYVFCDVFLFHQVMDILIRQLCVPYHYNAKLLKRWTYKAKKTDMLMDVIPFEECRYVYDWMPTIDMFENGIDDLERQLILRFALDGISKHSHWYSEEFLSGTAVTSFDKEGFHVHEFAPRIKLE